MDKKYITLFKEIAQTTAAAAETVMEYNETKSDTQGVKTAATMRDDYQTLVDTINAAGDNYVPTRTEIARLLIGATIIARQLEDRIKNLKQALTGYQTDVLPKLQQVLDKTKSDDEVASLVNELFIITENN